MLADRTRILEIRFKLLRLVREFFWQKGFLEVETPTVVASPGMEPNLKPLGTTVKNERGEKFRAGLITSPEYAMKKLLAAGFKDIFQICKCFRNNEPFGGLHNPEFTMIEWYGSGCDYMDIMRDVEELFIFLHKKIYYQISNFSAFAPLFAKGGATADKQFLISKQPPHSPPLSLTRARVKGQGELEGVKNQNSEVIVYQDKEIDISLPWERISVCEAFEKYAKIDLKRNLDIKSIREAAEAKGYGVNKNDTFSDIFFKIFLTEIEPNLGKTKPTFIYDYPIEMGALARPKKNDEKFAERFELYISGVEIANAFSELTDAKEQLRRLKLEAKEKKLTGKTVFPIDYEFIEAVGKMPDCAGIALGIDRLFMILLDVKDINDIIPFPAAELFKK